MSQLLVEPEVKQQLKASQILRMTDVVQCKNNYHVDGKYCAMGAIMHYFGWNGYNNQDYNATGFKKLNISAHVWGIIMSLNDSYGKSFSEIADWLEERGL